MPSPVARGPVDLAIRRTGTIGLIHRERGLECDARGIPERPEVFVAVASNNVEIKPNDLGLALRAPGTAIPAMGQYWRHGKRLSDAEGERIVPTAMGDDWTPPACEEGH